MMTARVIGLIAAMGVALLGAAGLVTAQATRPGETIQLWEYHLEIVRSPASTLEQRAESRRGPSSSADSVLNSWGRSGWELVGVTRREVRADDVLETETLYAFKRPLRAVNR